LRQGRTTSVVDCDVTDQEGRLVAKALMTFSVSLPKPQYALGPPISRLAECTAPFRRMAIPGTDPPGPTLASLSHQNPTKYVNFREATVR
jgi:hypothetical protein